MRSWILVPADDDEALGSIVGAGADVVVIDLARTMSPGKQTAARIAAQGWLRSHREQLVAARRFQRWVRISDLGTPHWREDLEAAMAGSPHGIVMANCRGTDDIRQLASVLYEIEDRLGLGANVTRIVPELASTPATALTVGRIAEDLHPRVAALTWDAVGLAHAIGARRLRGPGGRWSDGLAFVRAQVLLIAHSCGIGALEHPFRDIKDSDAAGRVAEAARADGFTGMLAIHPGQLPAINAAFQPTEGEISEARQILSAFATNPGAASVPLGGRRVGQADLLRARRVLDED